MNIDAKSILAATGFGLLAGMRSMGAPALVSNYVAQNRKEELQNTAVSFLESNGVATLLQLLAAGEVIADKLPFVPARTTTASLVWRGVSGAVVGATVGAVTRRQIAVTALLGSAAALGGAYAAYHSRRYAKEQWGLPDALLGVIEDGIVAGVGIGLARVTSRAAP